MDPQQQQRWMLEVSSALGRIEESIKNVGERLERHEHDDAGRFQTLTAAVGAIEVDRRSVKKIAAAGATLGGGALVAFIEGVKTWLG